MRLVMEERIGDVVLRYEAETLQELQWLVQWNEERKPKRPSGFDRSAPDDPTAAGQAKANNAG